MVILRMKKSLVIGLIHYLYFIRTSVSFVTHHRPHSSSRSSSYRSIDAPSKDGKGCRSRRETAAFFRPSRIVVYSSLNDEYGIKDRFDRWKLLQNLLEAEADGQTINSILYHVLDGTLKYPRPKYANSDETGSPEITAELRFKIEAVLSSSSSQSVKALSSECTVEDEQVVSLLEGLLPDPEEEEDAFKGLWDTVIELHGREGVKINEGNPTEEWKVCCLVARVLLHYDFLILGIVDAPLQ